MTQATLTAVFGWMTVLNIGMLLFATVVMLVMPAGVSRLHQRLFGLSEADVKRTYFNWLAGYKMLTLVFCLAPYLALRLA